MARIVACVADTVDHLRLIEGVARLRDHHGTRDVLDPVSSLSPAVASGHLGSGSVLVTDLRSPHRADATRCPREIDELLRVAEAAPRLRVLALVEERGRLLAREPNLGIEAFSVRDQAGDPMAVACALLRMVPAEGLADLLDILPDHLPSRYVLALARAFRAGKRLPTDKDLASWAGRPVEIMQRDFLRAGLREPAECALLVRLLGATYVVKEQGSCLAKAAARFGFNDEGGFH